MYTLENCKREYINGRVKYFKKYFLNKPINVGTFYAFEDSLKCLSSAYIGFLLLYDCLNIISESDDFKTFYNKETKSYTKTTIKKLKVLYQNLEDILLPLCEGFSGFHNKTGE